MVAKFFESIILPFLALKVRVQAFMWQRHVQKIYYSNESFCSSDKKLLERYQLSCPYDLSKQFMEAKGALEVHVYGETPLRVYDEIASRWGLKSHHLFVELGAGRGRGLLFLASLYGCKCVGIEWIPEFVQRVKGLHPQVVVYKDDFLTTTHLEGDYIYLYGTCLEDEVICKLCDRFLMLQGDCKIITVSFPLREYHRDFCVVDAFDGVFPWGKGTVYLNMRS